MLNYLSTRNISFSYFALFYFFVCIRVNLCSCVANLYEALNCYLLIPAYKRGSSSIALLYVRIDSSYLPKLYKVFALLCHALALVGFISIALLNALRASLYILSLFRVIPMLFHAHPLFGFACSALLKSWSASSYLANRIKTYPFPCHAMSSRD